ncbi:MAG: peptidyl-prolyl cis-trans isomerase [Verrucomicrobia bacterium]|nr:peptidyl-prolyl cis-trans isomerase [Verrucomicrobiota bacterium]
MLEFFRRHRGAFLTTLTVIIILSFSVWGGWKSSNGEQMATSSDPAFTIYGREYSVGEMQKYQRYQQVIYMLQMYDLLGLSQAAQEPEAKGNDFVYNVLVLQRQMDELGIHPSDAEAKAELEKQNALQENGKYSPQRAYNLQQNLGMYGMSGGDLLEVAKISIGYNKVQELIGKNYIPSPVETEKAYASRNQTLKIQTIDFKLEDFKKAAQVKDEEIQKYYDEKKDSYKSTEKRAVSYVLFENPKDVPPPAAPDPKTPDPKAAEVAKKAEEDKQTKLKEQVELVNKFNAASFEPTAKFDDIAKNLKVKAEVLSAFTNDAAPEAIKDEADLLKQIFAINKEHRPISDPVKGTKGYYIFTVTKIEESKQQALAEVKDKVKETLVAQKAQEAMSKAVNEARTALTDGLKAGKKVEDLAKDKKLTLAPVKELSIAEPPADLPNAYQISPEAEKTPAGAVTKAIDTDTGAILVYVSARELRKRDDSAALRKTTEDRNASDERKRLFEAWFAGKRKEAAVRIQVKLEA